MNPLILLEESDGAEGGEGGLGSLFLSVGDLPLHPLVVHAAVVLLPVGALILLICAFSGWARRKWLGLGTLVTVLGMIAAFIADQSGEALAGRIGTPADHAAWAERMMVASGILTVLAVIWWLLSVRALRSAHRGGRDRSARSPLRTILGFIVALAAVVSLVCTVMTGHEGAKATWHVDQTGAQSSKAQTATGQAPASGKTYTTADLKQHASKDSCWTAIDGGVYDLTQWVGQHPGGEGPIESLCGTDGSQAFEGMHGGDADPKAELQKLQIGTLQH